ncbi:MAG: TonB-dependent receptor [Halioglobus sp.]
MKRTALTVFLAVVGFVPASVTAEAPGARSLEEIIVTAQRRSQSLQDVPISISVVSADDIARNSLFDFTDTAQLTPGVSLQTSSAALASIIVRGVGPGFFAPTAQSVPVFVDEIPASQPGVVFNTMVDVERVELLRGPQGTLYGKNAPSGAYNITTATPRFDKVEGYVSGSYSHWAANNEPTTDIRGALNVPITDKVAARLAGVYAQSEGGIDMGSPFASDDATGGKDHSSLRAKLLWDISENSQLHVIGNYQDLEDYWSLRVYDGLVPSTGGSNPVDAIYTEFSDREDFSGRRSESGTMVKDIAFKYEWNGDLTNVDVIFGYQDFDATLFQNQNPTPTVEPSGVDFDLGTQQTTLELRVSDTGGVLDYVAGIFISDAEAEAFTLLDTGTVVPATVDQDNSGVAVFGNFTFHLSEHWDVSAGMRYEDNSQEYVSQVDIVGFEGNLDENLDFDHLSWSLKLNYFASENTTAYLAIDNAYRQGGINSYVPAMLALGEVLDNQAILDTAQVFQMYDEEVSTAFEIGLKGSAFDKKLRYTLAVFYQEFEDHIIRQNDPSADDLQVFGPLYTLLFTNAEDVVTQGFEFEFTYLLSERWTIDFRSAYFDATVDEWQSRLCAEGLDEPGEQVFCAGESGSELSELPKWNTNTQVSYFRPLDAGWSMFSTLSWTFNSESARNSNVTSRYDDPLHFINLNVGFTNTDFTVTLWGKNLTDEQNVQTPFLTENGDPDLPSALTANHDAGPQYGVTVAYTF